MPNVRDPQRASPSIDLSPFRRIWVAGFVTNTNPDIDLNAETVRLLRRRLKSRTVLGVVEAEPINIPDESALSDSDRWRRLGEEYGGPLIVTGSVTLVAARPVAAQETSGRGTRYVSRKGFVLEAAFFFIDGRTGEVIVSDRLPKEKAYGDDARASTMSLYFQLMDRVLPRFLHTFGPERLIGRS